MECFDLFIETVDPPGETIDVLLAGQIELGRKRLDSAAELFFDFLLAGNFVQGLPAAGNDLIHHQACILADALKQ